VHELTHIKRHDRVTQALAQAACAIYWFNPLVWLACAELRRDSEQACDDAVLDAGVPPRAYATHLLQLARHCRRPLAEAALPIASARRSTLERRIAAMLNVHLDRRGLSPRALIGTALVVAAVTVPAAALRLTQTSPLPFKGTVYDPSGAVLPEVAVTIEDAQQNKQQATTDANGRFEFPSVGPGTYMLEASLAGFRKLRNPVQLNSAGDWDRAVTLQVGDVEEEITVRARRPSNRAAAPAAAPVRIGGNIKAPTKLHDVHPVYPAAMRDAGLEGAVRMDAVIGRDGTVTSVRVVSAQVHPDFANAALDAVRQWRFSPTLLNGEPVDVVMTVSVAFKLSD